MRYAEIGCEKGLDKAQQEVIVMEELYNNGDNRYIICSTCQHREINDDEHITTDVGHKEFGER
jgi:hypothetical protein